MMLGIVIVTYKSYDRIRDYVELDLLPAKLTKRIVVVDVGSERSSAERIASLLGVKVREADATPEPNEEIMVLHLQENLGYARGNNYGARYLLRHFPEIDQLLFSNDDVRFLKGPVLETLTERMKSMPDVGVIGPDVIDLKGKHQGPLVAHPTIWQTILINLLEPLFGRGFVDKRYRSAMLNRVSGRVSILSGCFLLADAKAFLQAGMFDERTFLFWEEELLAKRMEAIGKSFYYEDGVRIQHLVGASLKQGKGPNLLQLKCMLAGGNLYFRHYDRCGLPVYLLLRFSNAVRTALVYLALLKFKLKSRLGLVR